MAGLIERQNGRGLKRLSVSKITGSGAVVLDVAGRDAIELTLTGASGAVTWSGWHTSTDVFQGPITVTVKQDATGGHLFDWRQVQGEWLERLPEPSLLDMAPGDTTLVFRAWTDDNGINVTLEPIGIEYQNNCTFVDAFEIDIPDVAAGGSAEIGHNFSIITSVELVRQQPVGRRVLADWWQQDGTASANINIDFLTAVAAGDFKARVAGKQEQPCELRPTLSLWETAVLPLANAAGFDPTITHDGSPADVTLDPGDGTGPISVASLTPVTYNYGAAGNYNAVLRWRKGVKVTTISDATGPWAFNLSSLPSSLEDLRITSGANTVSGSLGDLPRGVTFYQVLGNNTTSGLMSELPTGLTFYQNWGQNTTAGLIDDIPAGVMFYENFGQNTTAGNIGNLPAGLTRYQNLGNNTTSGSFDVTRPAGLTYFENSGNNTTSGDLANLPAGLTYYSNAGANTTTGSLAALPAGLTFYFNQGNNAATYPGGYGFAAVNSQFLSRTAAGHSTAEVDQILIDMAAAGVAPTTPPQTVDLAGANQPPTPGPSPAATAILTLTGLGWTVNTN